MNFHAVGRLLKIYFAVVVLVSLVLGYIVHSRFIDNADLRRQLMGDFARLAKLARTDIGVPSSASVREMASRVTQLSELYGATLDALSVKYEEMPVLTPLEFKEELLRFSNDVKRTAAEKGISIDPTLGFAEYTGGKIPNNNDMPVLSQQLYIIKDLIEMMLVANIRQINSIELIPMAQTEAKNKGKIYRSMELKTDISSGFYSVVDFLKALYGRPEVIWLNGLELRRDQRFTSDQQVLRSEMSLEFLVHKEDFFESTRQGK